MNQTGDLSIFVGFDRKTTYLCNSKSTKNVLNSNINPVMIEFLSEVCKVELTMVLLNAKRA